MILTTIIVPMVSFMLVFVYVIFYTGAKDQIPYKSIENEESEKHIENEESEKNIQYDENEKSIQNEKSEIGDSRLRNVET